MLLSCLLFVIFQAMTALCKKPKFGLPSGVSHSSSPPTSSSSSTSTTSSSTAPNAYPTSTSSTSTAETTTKEPPSASSQEPLLYKALTCAYTETIPPPVRRNSIIEKSEGFFCFGNDRHSLPKDDCKFVKDEHKMKETKPESTFNTFELTNYSDESTKTVFGTDELLTPLDSHKEAQLMSNQEKLISSVVISHEPEKQETLKNELDSMVQTYNLSRESGHNEMYQGMFILKNQGNWSTLLEVMKVSPYTIYSMYILTIFSEKPDFFREHLSVPFLPCIKKAFIYALFNRTLFFCKLVQKYDITNGQFEGIFRSFVFEMLGIKLPYPYQHLPKEDLSTSLVSLGLITIALKYRKYLVGRSKSHCELIDFFFCKSIQPNSALRIVPRLALEMNSSFNLLETWLDTTPEFLNRIILASLSYNSKKEIKEALSFIFSNIHPEKLKKLVSTSKMIVMAKSFPQKAANMVSKYFKKDSYLFFSFNELHEISKIEFYGKEGSTTQGINILRQPDSIFYAAFLHCIVEIYQKELVLDKARKDLQVSLGVALQIEPAQLLIMIIEYAVEDPFEDILVNFFKYKEEHGSDEGAVIFAR